MDEQTRDNIERFKPFIGKEVDISWTETEGWPGGMGGVLVSIDETDDEVWANLDWGYSAALHKGRFEIKEAK